MSAHSNNRQIAKNTAILYVRMLFSMIVSLYTSRVVLNTLGVDDYGIFNVVGGIVAMFGFLNGAMASGTQRFLNYEMGTGNLAKLKSVFNASLAIHIGIAAIIFVLAETVGLWFLHTYLVIPVERMDAAIWVYQFSIFAAMVTLTQVPFTAVIIANEKMNIYGYVGIVEVLLRLLIVYMLVVFSYDKLKLFAILTFAVSVIVAVIYRMYCNYKFLECKFQLSKDKSLYKELLSFSSWNLFGNMAQVAMNQGQNILLNMFFGPVVNAARAIAVSVNSAVQNFSIGFQTAANPQIIQTYSSNNFEIYQSLIFKVSKFSFFILFLIAGPVLIETNYILKLWLINVPEFSIEFTQLTLINAMLTALIAPMYPAIQATGKIKLYQIFVGGTLILNLPLGYLLLKQNGNPYGLFILMLALNIISIVLRLLIFKKIVPFFQLQEFVRVIMNVLLISFISVIIPFCISKFYSESLARFVVNSAIFLISYVLFFFIFSTKQSEKTAIISYVKNKVQFK